MEEITVSIVICMGILDLCGIAYLSSKLFHLVCWAVRYIVRVEKGNDFEKPFKG